MFVLARFALDDVHELIDFKLHVVAGLVDDLHVLKIHVMAWMSCWCLLQAEVFTSLSTEY